MARRMSCAWIAVVFASCSAGCFGPRVVGNGVQMTEDRPVTDFHALAGSGVGDYRVTRSDKPSLKVRAEENLLPHIRTEVVEGVLRVGEDNGNYEWHGYPQFDVAAKDLRSFEMSGRTSLTAETIATDSLDARASGQSTLTLAGKVQSLVVDVSGQCTCQAGGLKCRKATVHCSGQCRVVVDVTDELDVEASGMCTVEYVGKPPKLNVNTSGLSKVIAHK